MKILITAGGGGHFSPALAVIKKLPQDIDVLFIGRKYAFEQDKTLSFEYHTIKERGIPFRTITTGRLQRSVSISTGRSLLKLPVGFWQSFRILKEFQPDVVFSTGGYVGVPVTIAAHMLGIPVVLHEQTMRAGLANRLAAFFAVKICLSWDASKAYFPSQKVVMTGNPVKEAALKKQEVKNPFSNSRPIIFVTGGSLGSHAINVLIEGVLEKILAKYNLIHQTGDAREYQDYTRLEKRRSALPEDLQACYQLTKFIPPDEITGVFRLAALVIGRSGINTVTELIAAQKPSLLIPLPHGQRNEQLENAQYLASLGLARVRKQEDLTPETVYTEIEEIMEHRQSFKLNRDVSDLIREDAAEKIIATLFSVAKTVHQTAEKKTAN